MVKSTPISAYEKLVQEIKLSYGAGLTEIEAHQAARNLMRFCQKLIEVNTRLEKEEEKTEYNVDLQRINGNVTTKL